MLNSDFKFTDFIWVKKKSLTPYFCKKLIKKFDEEPNIYDGIVGKGLDKTVKDTKDFKITAQDENWKQEDSILFKALSIALKEYQEYLTNFNPSFIPTHSGLIDSGYKLQRYEPGGFYKWHQDFLIDHRGTRVYVYMWYLNTIKKKDEGYTEFIGGTKLQPRCGDLVMFPATWDFLHRGYPPKVRKYLCNGWVYTNPT